MTSTREELRDELLSAIAAAPELTPDARSHLADVFLDRLERDYRLVPRTGGSVTERRSALPHLPGGVLAPWPLLAAILGFILLLSLVSTSMLMLVHPPILLFAVLIVLAVRSRSHGPRRRTYL